MALQIICDPERKYLRRMCEQGIQFPAFGRVVVRGSGSDRLQVDSAAVGGGRAEADPGVERPAAAHPDPHLRGLYRFETGRRYQVLESGQGISREKELGRP